MDKQSVDREMKRLLQWYENAKTSQEARNAKACIESLKRIAQEAP